MAWDHSEGLKHSYPSVLGRLSRVDKDGMYAVCRARSAYRAHDLILPRNVNTAIRCPKQLYFITTYIYVSV